MAIFEKVEANKNVPLPVKETPESKSIEALGLQVANLTVENSHLKQNNQQLEQANKQLNTSMQALGMQVATMITKEGTK